MRFALFWLIVLTNWWHRNDAFLSILSATPRLLPSCRKPYQISTWSSKFLWNKIHTKSGLKTIEIDEAQKQSYHVQYPHGMTKNLAYLAEQLRDVPIDSLRYQQLLFFASVADPMDQQLKIPANKVQGCQSQVFVHCTVKEEFVDNEKKLLLYYTADSDSMLTKGLISLLVQGLSGHTVEEISRVEPEFIQYAGITQSLTPGRNSGLLNMLNTMKNQAKIAVLTATIASEKNQDSKISPLSTEQ